MEITHKNSKSKSNYHHMIVMRKMRGLLPSSFSSCQFRSLPDVAESSITITTKSSASKNIIINSSKKPTTPLRHHSPPLTPVKKLTECKVGKSSGAAVCGNHHSSSSHSGLFTSSDDKTRGDIHDFDLSFSSNSGDSFRRFGRRCQHDHQMKSIDEEVKKTTFPDHELGSDHIFTQLYYKKSRRSKSNLRRRKIKKGAESKVGPVPMIENSYAVEKSSSDPCADFRASMVEMILHKQLFGSEDLERLLLCFLSLNAVSYHGIIYHVFSEICQTLFAN